MTDADTLKARTEALNRVAAENDRLRATLARVEALADQWERDSARLIATRTHYANRAAVDAAGLRAALEGTR